MTRKSLLALTAALLLGACSGPAGTDYGSSSVSASGAVIDVSGVVNESMRAGIVRAVEAAPGKAITLRLNSPGGVAESGYAIADYLRSLKSRGYRITTSVDRQCSSACPLVYMQGDTRVATAGSRWLLHGVTEYGIDGMGRIVSRVEREYETRKYLERLEADGLDEDWIRIQVMLGVFNSGRVYSGQQLVDQGANIVQRIAP